MELKVWVDGIKRVVCGVTDNTTCQDIVIALAQAMHRTGRFTLIEKWRENERPLSPNECPLLVLQKWGEFASEVKLMLYESKRKQKQVEKQNDIQKDPDRFTHNFTPPVKTSEAVIRRSLTFSGGRKLGQNSYRPERIDDFPSVGSQGLVPNQHQSRHLQIPDKGTSDGNSWSSNSSLSSQNSTMLPHQPHRRRSSSHDRVTSSRNDKMTSSAHEQMAPSALHDQQRTSPVQHSAPSPQYFPNGPQFSERQPQFSERQPQFSDRQPQFSDRQPQFSSKSPQFSNQDPQFSHSSRQKPVNHNSIPGVSSSIPNNFTFQNHKQSDNIPDGSPSYQAPPLNKPAKPLQNQQIANGPYHNSQTLKGPVSSSVNNPSVNINGNGPLHNDRLPVKGSNFQKQVVNGPVQKQAVVSGSVQNQQMLNGVIQKQHTVNGPVPKQQTVNRAVHSSAFLPVQSLKGSSGEITDSQRISNSNMGIPIYTDVRKSSHKHDLEEYDLDSNFPDVVKETGQDRLIEEFHMPGSQGQGHERNLMSREEAERVKLLRLVTKQNERIKMQDSQLEIVDIEITSREQKVEDLKMENDQTAEEIRKLTELSQEQDDEINKLDNGKLIDEIEQEKLNEREIKNQISALKSRLQKCENDLRQFQSKVQICSKDLELEKDVLKTDEKRRREEELKLQAEVSELIKEIDNRSKEAEEKSKLYESVAKELEQVSEQLQKKTDDLTTTEKELQRENLKFFQPPPTSENKGLAKTDGEAVLKVLEGSLTPKLKRSNVVVSPLTVLEMTKKESGVWV